VKPPACLALLIALALCDPQAHAQARGFFGVGLADAPGVTGAQVGVLAPGGPAEQAGVRVGDIVVAIDGRPAGNAAAAAATLAALSAGQPTKLTILREGQRLVLPAVMGARPAEGARSGAEGQAPPGPSPAASPQGRARSSPPASVAPLKVSAYTTFTEPSEHAFTIEVPSGWQVVGSQMRRAALEFSPFVRTLSPDRMTYLMVGEPTLLSYTPPSALTARLGWREGSLHDAQLGGVSMLLRYIPGPQFARMYGQSALAGLCPQMHFETAEERADFVAAADQLIPTVIPSQSSGGEASFSCRHAGQDMAVRVDAVTRIDRNSVQWNVIFLRAFITPKSQAAAAADVLKHMTTSTRYEPAWLNTQQQIERWSSAQIAARIRSAEQQEQGFIKSLNATDQNFSSMDDIVSGYSTYRNNQTGDTYKLSNTNPGKWVGGGRIISTPDGNPPPWAPAAQPMTRVD
jgi:hypothetical protein